MNYLTGLRTKAEGVPDNEWMSVDARLVIELLDRIDQLEAEKARTHERTMFFVAELKEANAQTEKLLKARVRIEELEAWLIEVMTWADEQCGCLGSEPGAADAVRAFRDERECNHDWYRAAGSPPDICLKCQKLEDRG